VVGVLTVRWTNEQIMKLFALRTANPAGASRLQSLRPVGRKTGQHDDSSLREAAELGVASMKRTLIIGALLLAMVLAGALWVSRTRSSREQQCRQHMQRLYSAAVSVCLEQRLRPDETLSIDRLAPYLRPSDLVCPASHTSYSSFSVLDGPKCPSGHEFEPGVPRPLRIPASNRKVAGLYLATGFTNLIDDLR
jgi:hypothetical protein